MQAKRYWVVSVTIAGTHTPTLERVSKQRVREGQKVFEDYGECLLECYEMDIKRELNEQS